MNKRVVIFGAGIAGLSAAHELAEKGYTVTVFEKFPQAGGVAKSKRDVHGFPTEYSWRGYAPWYHNVFNLMNRIPTTLEKTVLSNLSEPITFYFPHNSNKPLPIARLLLEGTKNAVACPARTAEYAKINAADYFKALLNNEDWEHLVSTFGPWVGIDPQRASLHHIISFFVKNAIPGPPSPYTYEKDGKRWTQKSLSGWQVLNAPTNDAWFDPWVAYLESLGVTFYFNSSVESFVHTEKVEYAIVNGQRIYADHFIMAITPFALENVLQKSKFVTPWFPGLVQDGPHIQVSFQIGFSEKVTWGGTRRAMILTKSEFNITLYRQDELWGPSANLGPGIVSLWSGTTCVSYIPGKLFGRPLIQLTKHEFEQEILYQLSKDVGFNNELQQANKKTFAELPIVHFNVWDSWKFNQPITTDEPKYVDSTNTREFQPTVDTTLPNLWMAGAHTRTSTDLWSMESAAESGRRAAQAIACTNVITQNRGLIIDLLQRLDAVCYSLGLPNVMYVLLGFLIVFIAWLLLRRSKFLL